MKPFRSFVLLTFCLLAVSSLHAQTAKLTPVEAKNHIGDRATVCGEVVSTHYAKSSKGELTFINLNEPYQREVFTILIWTSDRAKLGTPEDEYKGLRVCVTGKTTSFYGWPEIVPTGR